MANTHVLFEEDGVFKAGTVLADAGTSLQVEAASGKRSKVKTASVMLRFPSPAPTELMQRAHEGADAIDLDFLWECAPQDEFEFTALAGDYFGHAPSPVEAASLLFRLHGAPVYFHRKGRGRYRPAPPDTLKAALAAVERKRQQERAVDEQAAALAEGRLPAAIAREAARLLVRPDRNGVEFKALERACAATHQSPERLLLAVGAFADARDLHLRRFLAEHFPQGAEPPADGHDLADERLATIVAGLPLSEAATFSIDDSTTTEIDDCLSVQELADGRLRVGVHIAAPAVAIAPDGALDRIARERMSTVYMPGDKITMLPQGPIERFSLAEGRELPALSLYVDLDAAGRAIVARDTRVERIRVGHNLRHDHLESTVTEAALEEPAPGAADPLAALPQAAALRALWRLTLALSGERDRFRGKPELRHRVDFSFYVEGDVVRIVQRRRDSPLDRIVAELMILANSEWGRLLAERGAPGVYRSQAAGRVRMSTHPLPHQGIGVPQYCWCTSPLRRYVDLVNQRQIVAVVAGERPPFAPNDAALFSIISAFDARYGAYAEFQQRMERYWCLRWVAQQPATRLEAVVVRDDLVRLAQAPLYFRLTGMPELAAGRRIVVDVLDRDEVDLSLSARFVEVAAGPSADGGADEAIGDGEVNGDGNGEGNGNGDGEGNGNGDGDEPAALAVQEAR